MGEWEEISYAPLGRSILVCGNGWVDIGIYGKGAYGECWYGTDTDITGDYNAIEPTHWMELPEPMNGPA